MIAKVIKLYVKGLYFHLLSYIPIFYLPLSCPTLRLGPLLPLNILINRPEEEEQSVFRANMHVEYSRTFIYTLCWTCAGSYCGWIWSFNLEWPGVGTGKGPWTVKDGSIPIPVRRVKDFREEKRRMGYLVNKQSDFNTYIGDKSDRLIL